jgi:poly(A) polymerase
MTAPETEAVMRALEAGGEARFVGGCVRDAIAQRPVGDIDIATPAPPERVMEMLESAGIKAIPTGIGHGTVTAVVDSRKFEITTLRRDVETDGRHARVEYIDDWVVDARRRDFTINTLSSTPGGDVYDPLGGMDDLGRGLVRFVGIPMKRIEEDLLRLLRFFRFQAAYGRPPADREALLACRTMAPRLSELSGERVREEMFRILLAPDPADTAVLMRGAGVFDVLLPEAGDVGRLRMLTWLEGTALNMTSVAPDVLRRLAALLDPGAGGAGADAVAARFRLSNHDAVRLAAAAAPVQISPNTDPPGLRRALHRLRPDAVRDSCLLAWAGELALTPRLPAERTGAWRAILEAADSWHPLAFPLKGRDVTALGVAPGPAVGKLLAAVEEWWEDADYEPGHDACLEKLKSLADNG